MSDITDKLRTLQEKINGLTKQTNAFKSDVKERLTDIIPLVNKLKESVAMCNMNDTEAAAKKDELEKLIKEKDEKIKKLLNSEDGRKDLESSENFSDFYVKKTEITDIDDKIDKAITDLDSLLSSNSDKNKEIQNLIKDIETALEDAGKKVESDTGEDDKIGLASIIDNNNEKGEEGAGEGEDASSEAQATNDLNQIINAGEEDDNSKDDGKTTRSGQAYGGKRKTKKKRKTRRKKSRSHRRKKSKSKK